MVTRPEMYVFAVNYRPLAHTHTHTHSWLSTEQTQQSREMLLRQRERERDRQTGRDSCCCCWYGCRRVRLYLLPSERASVSIYCCVCVRVSTSYYSVSLWIINAPSTLHITYLPATYTCTCTACRRKKTVTSSHVWKQNLAYCVISINATWWSYINVRSKAGS